MCIIKTVQNQAARRSHVVVKGADFLAGGIGFSAQCLRAMTVSPRPPRRVLRTLSDGQAREGVRFRGTAKVATHQNPSYVE